MNVSDLAKGVAEATGSNEAVAKKAITAVFDQIAAASVWGEEVSIPGFGKFTVYRRARLTQSPTLNDGLPLTLFQSYH